MSSSKTTVVSAPGKVLIAGGYLVLDPAYPGLVIATDSRFYTFITDEEDSNQVPQSTILVESPQFIGARWHYKVRKIDSRQEKTDWFVEQTRETYSSPEAGQNPFLSLAILYSLRLISELKGSSHLENLLLRKGLKIVVVGDNDFYSQRVHDSSQQSSKPAPAPTTSYLKSLDPFESQQCAIRQVHKTGLGSSAAMTTSVVGALMLHLEGVSPQPQDSTPSASGTPTQTSALSEQDLALIHNLAQLAHCAAQGKVGSGFDVSSAIWGSQLFRRFDPKVLKTLLEDGAEVTVEGEGQKQGSTTSLELLPFLDPSNPLWHPSPLSSSTSTSTPTAAEGLAVISSSSPSNSHKTPRPAPLELPPFIKLVLADVDTGSNTPSLVSKVNEWKSSKPEWSKQLFHILSISNQSLADNLLGLSISFVENPQEYKAMISKFSKVKSMNWDSKLKEEVKTEVGSLLVDLRNSLRSIRAGMRELGQRSKAEIEPDEMGRILKASIEGENGILGGGVPGAGGFDALYLLYLIDPHEAEGGEEENRMGVENIWKGWKELSVGPLLSQAGGAIPSDSYSSEKVELEKDGEEKETGQLENQVRKAMELNSKNDGTRLKAGLCIEKFEEVEGLKKAVERRRR